MGHLRWDFMNGFYAGRPGLSTAENRWRAKEDPNLRTADKTGLSLRPRNCVDAKLPDLTDINK